MEKKKMAPIFVYTSYRAFLRDWIKDRNWSYRQFIDRYGDFVSFIALAKTLSRGRSRGREASGYRMSPEVLARLGRAMGLMDEELCYLLLLRLENDGEELEGQHGSTFVHLMHQLLHDYKLSSVHEYDSADEKKSVNSQSAQCLVEVFEELPEKFRRQVLEEVQEIAGVYAHRQKGKVAVEQMHDLIRKLKRLFELGAP